MSLQTKMSRGRKTRGQDHPRPKAMPYIDITATGKNVPEYRYSA